jgi:hypothetical protein
MGINPKKTVFFLTKLQRVYIHVLTYTPKTIGFAMQILSAKEGRYDIQTLAKLVGTLEKEITISGFEIPKASGGRQRNMRKTKYLALLAVAVIFMLVLSGTSHPIGGEMFKEDGVKHAAHQTNTPPVVDGVVQVGLTWPSQSFIGHTYIANKGGGIVTTDVYLLFDNLAGYTRTDNPPINEYGPEDEQGYYFYIGVKAVGGYTIDSDGSWVVIDWDQDGLIDFDDHNGNSANPGPNGGYSTQFARTANGVEWAIPYIDDFNGVCQSPFYITVHIEIVRPGGGGTETTTFPDRAPGKFLSTEICVGDLISPEPPEEPGEWGLRTIGFWKHQFSTALGLSKGHQHVPTTNLINYINEISTESNVPELNDMDTDMLSALSILELRGPHSMYDKAVQQLLATWLNFVSDGDQMVDTDGDEVTDMLLSDAIAFIEDILTDPNSTHEDWELAKDMADTINNSGDE